MRIIRNSPGSGILALTAGVIWDRIGPQYLFLAFLGIDVLIRMPLLVSIPETLRTRFRSTSDGRDRPQ